MSLSGHVGQIRVALRRDIAPASFGSATVEEVPGTIPCGNDVLLVVKRFMADSNPIRVITVCTAHQAQALRQKFCQPWGVADRRQISENVKKNISAKVGPCVRQGVMTLTAAAYLTNWVAGTLVQKPRPASYAYLRRRLWGGPVDDNAPRWARPQRERHIDLTCQGEEVQYFSESEVEDNDAVMLANAD